MPLAAHIPALPASNLPIPLEQGGAHGKAAPFTQVFGQMFREQAGPMQAPASAPPAERDDATSSPAHSQETEASSLTNGQQIEDGQDGTAPAVSPQTLFPAQSQNNSPSIVNNAGGIAHTAVEASEASLSSSEIAIAPNPASVTLSSQAPNSQQDAQQHKTNQTTHTAKQNTIPNAEDGGSPASIAPSVPPVAASITSPFLGESAPASPVVAPHPTLPDGNQPDGNKWMSATNGQASAGQKTTQPGLSESTENHPATPLPQKSQPPAGDQTPPVPGDVGPQTAAQKGSTSAPHGGHPAAELTAGTIAGSNPVEARSTEAGPAAPLPPRTEAPAASALPSATNAAAAPAPNLYDKIDQGAAPVVLHSGAQQVAVGVRDSNLGWVEIKTQNIAGQVDATLSTASGQTHSALAAQLPAMAQYLEQRDVRVGSLAVQHEMSQVNTGAGQNGGSASGAPGSGGSGSNGAGAQNSNSADSGGDGSSMHARVSPGSPSGIEEAGSSFRPLSYISVRA